MESDQQKKGSFRDRTMVLRHRVLWWMHRYLALDVAPQPAETPARLQSAISVPEPRVVPGRQAVETPSARAFAARVSRPGADPIPIFAAGECIGEVYDVIRVVNTEAFSSTYLAHHRQWDIDLIVRVPSQELAPAPALLREWVASAERWAGLGVHPHITSCYCVQWLDGIPVAVVEYVGEDSLRTWMAQAPHADLRVALNVVIGICHGLEHLHGHNVIHGSLTPDSILLTPQGTPKLSDFEAAMVVGLQAPAAAPSESDDMLATPAACRLRLAPAYVAPERWGAAYVTQPTADVFSLGVCLYEMCFGRQPYAATAGAPQALPDATVLLTGDAAPDVLSALVLSCLEWTPYRRPTSIEAVRYELCALYETLFGGYGGQLPDSAREAAEWNTKAVSCYLMGNEADADAAWASALAADPTCLDVWFNRDVALWRRGLRTDETVLEDIGAVVVPQAERWKVCYLRALVHHERGDLESALESLEQGHRERPDSVEINIALDRIRAACNRAPAHPPIVGTHREYVTAVALSANPRLGVSASYDGTVVLWDIMAGNQVRMFEGHGAAVSSVFLNAAGSMVLTGSDDGTLQVWETASGACLRNFATRAGRISSACLSPDDRFLLWAGVQSSDHVEQMTLQLWDVHTGRHLRLFEGVSSAIKSVCFSADGSWVVTGGDDQTVRIWDVETGKCQQVFAGHAHYVSAVSISPDNRFILSGSWDRTVRLWDVASGERLRTFEGHTALVTSVCLSADAQSALSGSWDSSVRLWDVTKGRCVWTYRGHSGLVTGVALSADGRRGISGSWDRTVRVWDTAAERREACQLRVSTGHDGDTRPA